MSDSYLCHTCGVEYDTIPKAMACSNSHEAEPGSIVELTDEVELPAEKPDPYPVKAAELLGRAAMHMHDRSATYDKPEGERSVGRTVQAFNAITGHTLSESEGWLFMALLKAVRSEARTEPHQDSLEDLIAYAALYAEARGKGL